jgi:orotate phosphoribosyltransferase
MVNNPVISEKLASTDGYRDLHEPVILASGQLGIYFVNTEKILGDDDKWKDHGADAEGMARHVRELYQDTEGPFKPVIDELAARVGELLPTDTEYQAISGGQRRDWPFAAAVAEALDLEFIALYKQEDGEEDRVEVIGTDGTVSTPDLLEGYGVVHLVDLITEGSSVYRDEAGGPKGWVQMLRDKRVEGDYLDVVAVVTRLQGGEERLAAYDVNVHPQVAIDDDFLGEHSEDRFADRNIAYRTDPDKWTRDYLAENGALALASTFSPTDGKIPRAKRFLERYGDHLKDTMRPNSAYTEGGNEPEQISAWDELNRAVDIEYSIRLNNVLTGEPNTPTTR